MGNRNTIKRRAQRKRAKEKDKMTYGQGYETMLIMNDFFKLASTPSQSCAKTEPVKQGENPMYVDYVSNDKHTESAKTNYLLGRFTFVKDKHRQELMKQFGLYGDEPPQTAQELVDRITSGKFVLPTVDEENTTRKTYCWPYSPAYAIKWRDPAIKEDKPGFDATEEQLKTAALDVHDVVMIKTNDEALAAIKTFESWTPTASTTVKAN